jgi:hypothetical protein
MSYFISIAVMKTTRFQKPDIQFTGAGCIITGKCHDDKAVFIPYSRIKNVEFNKNLLQEDGCGGQDEHYFIVCENDEYYEIEGRACDIGKSLAALLENLK